MIIIKLLIIKVNLIYLDNILERFFKLLEIQNERRDLDKSLEVDYISSEVVDKIKSKIL